MDVTGKEKALPLFQGTPNPCGAQDGVWPFLSKPQGPSKPRGARPHAPAGSLLVLPPQVVDADQEAVLVVTDHVAHLAVINPLVFLREEKKKKKHQNPPKYRFVSVVLNRRCWGGGGEGKEGKGVILTAGRKGCITPSPPSQNSPLLTSSSKKSR